MAKLNMSPPWVLYYKKLNTLFDEDNDILVIYDEDEMEVKLYCTSSNKSEALSFLLPDTVSFGSVELKVTIIPSNEKTNKFLEGYKAVIKNAEAAIEILFNFGNGHVREVKTISTPFGDFTYVIFKKEVIQYFEDNLSDFYGNCSTLCETIAKEIFKDIEGIFFCTSIY